MANESKQARARGTGGLLLRKSGWYIRVYDVNGKQYMRATGTHDRAKAEQALARELAAKERGENPDARRVTYKQLRQLLLDDYSVRGLRSVPKLKHLDKAFANARALRITGAVVLAFQRKLLEDHAPATVDHALKALRRMFRLAVKHKLLTADQMPTIALSNAPNTRDGFFEPDDFAALLRELPDYLRPVIRFGYHTGWRVRSEVLPLQWAQVDRAAGTIRLAPGHTKNGEGRVFPYSALPDLKALIEEQHAEREELQRATGRIIPWVFHRNGQQIRDYRGAWENACKRASVEKRHGKEVIVRPQLVGRLVHDLRRTAVRNLERAGVARSVAMKLTGHLTESVYRRYAIVSERDLSEGLAKLAALPDVTPDRTVLPFKSGTA